MKVLISGLVLFFYEFESDLRNFNWKMKITTIGCITRIRPTLVWA